MASRVDDNQILVDHEETQDEVLDNRFGSEDEEHLFYLLGAASMAPWNFFVTAEDYWLYKFRNTSYNGTEPPPDLTPMQRNFTCDLTLTASLAGTTFLILNAAYGHHVNLRLKMLGTLTTMFVIFVITAVFVEIDTDSWQTGFFLMTMGTVIIINISAAVMCGGLFGIAGRFPSEYITAVVSGQALGGIFTALTFILALTYGASAKITAFAYFSIGILIVLLSIITFAIMMNQKFFNHFTQPNVITSSDQSGIVLEPSAVEVFGKVYSYTICIILVNAVTLSVYPGVTVLMQSEDAGKGYKWNDIYYMPVVNYLLFNSGDYLGRICAGLLEKPRKNPHLVLLLSLTRIVFIPLFLMSNTNLHYFLPTVVHSDKIFISLMALFAISNGYLTNNILIMAPRLVMQHEKEMASAIMAAALSSGIALGAILSMVFVELL